MNTESVRATLAYVLAEERDSDTATFELLLQPMEEGWVEVLIQDAHTDKVHTYMLTRDAPCLRQICVEQQTTFSVYVKDHWYIQAGGIWQVGWSSSRKCLELFTLCSSHLELVEIERLPLTLEEERAELAKEYATSTLVRYTHVGRAFETKDPTYKKVEFARSEEIAVEVFGQSLARGFAHDLPERAWIATFLCSLDEETSEIEQYVLVADYFTRPYYSCYRLSKLNGTFSLGLPY